MTPAPPRTLAVARVVAAAPGRLARALPFPPSLVGLVALLLANWLRIYLPGIATDGLFAATVAAVGLSLLRRPIPAGARATALCFAALIAACAFALALAPGVVGLRDLAGFPIAAILFLFAYRSSSEWSDSGWTARIFLVAFAALFLLYFMPSGINANVFSGILAYLCLAFGLLAFVAAGGKRKRGLQVVGFLASVVLIGVVFGNRSIMLAALAAGLAYWVGGAVLRSAVDAALAAAVVLLCVAGFTAFFGLPRFETAVANLDRSVRTHVGMPVNTGREKLWPAAFAAIRQAPWLGHGLGATVGDVARSPTSQGAAPLILGDTLCLPGMNPGLFEDCGVLLELRGALTDHESALWTWDFGQPLATWVGVSVGGATPRVVGLDLTRKGLEGPLPSVLGRLDGLLSLRLGGNRFEGRIPAELGALKNLRELALDENRLGGAVPRALGELPALSVLRLAGNDFDRPFPAALYETADHDLDLYDELFCLPSAGLDSVMFDDCSRLMAAREALAGVGGTRLNWRAGTLLREWSGVSFDRASQRVIAIDLEGRGLAGVVPQAFGGLDRLEVLRLGRNQLAGAIPERLTELRRLRVLDLADNRLGGAVPAAFGDLPALELLRLGGNGFTVCPPPKLREIVDHDLDMAVPCAGRIEGFPGLAADVAALLAARDALAGSAALNWRPDLPISVWRGVEIGGAPPRVAALTLTRVGLNGRIPPELGGMTRLVALRLNGNRLGGPVPEELGGLADLRELDLSVNVLTGSVPASLGRLSSLESLWLGGNRLSGSIPEELGGLADLRKLALDDNALTGSVPASLGRLSSLERLRLANNRLSGSIPEELGDLADLRALALQNNALTGSVPASLGRLSSLERLRLANNRLSGPIPEELGDLADLRELALQNNALTGPVPASLGRLSSLERLRLDGNPLSSRAPGSMAGLSRLSLLRPAGNTLSGLSPAAEATPAAAPRASVDSAASTTTLCRSTPELMDDCMALLHSRGHLTNWQISLNWGLELPVERWEGVTVEGDPPRVTALELRSVGLRGIVPSNLGGLSALRRLMLDGNPLRGAAPAALGELRALETLYLGDNGFAGCPPPTLQRVVDHDLDDTLCLPLPADAAGLAADAALLLDARDALTGDAATLNWSRRIPLNEWGGVTVAGSPPRVTELDLSHAGLSGRIPPELAKLEALAVLRLDGNALIGSVPAGLAESERLVELRLEGNALSGAPPLQELAFAAAFGAPQFCRPGGGANGRLLADCVRLLTMRDALSGDATLNWSRAIPLADWRGVRVDGAPPRVTALALPGVGLSGALPPDLGRLDRLASLRLQDNQLAGAVPAELGDLEFLEELDLSNNRLSGVVPRSLDALDRLSRLDLGDNFFTHCPAQHRNGYPLDDGLFCPPFQVGPPGPRVGFAGLAADAAVLLAARDALSVPRAPNWRSDVPVEEWRGVTVGGVPPRVVALDLSRTELDGRIPPELGGLTRLIALRLDGNSLSGPLPPALGDLADLRELALQGNALSGPLPPELGRLRNLEILRLDDNHMSGRIPVELGELKRLATARLDGNDLFGPLPRVAAAAVGDEEKLRDAPADIFCLKPLPDSGAVFADCLALLEARDALAGGGALDWSANLSVRSWRGVELGGDPARVIALHLPRAGLTGSLPAELGALDGLVSLQLQGNALTGNIPPEIAGLDRLRVLKLDGNGFSGCLPSGLAEMGGGSALGLGLPPCGLPAADMESPARVVERLTLLVDPETDRGRYISAHNQFLQTWLQTGAIGLIALVALCASLVFNLRTRGRVLPVHRYAFACVVFVLVHSTFEVFLFRVNMATIAWLLLGAGAAAAARAARNHGATQPAPT